MTSGSNGASYAGSASNAAGVSGASRSAAELGGNASGGGGASSGSSGTSGSNGALGPGDYFAKTLIGVVPAGDTIGLVPCAISGEKIETFLKVGGSKYNWLIARATLAQQAGGVIEGMLFHQGESNCGDTAWPGKVNTLVTDLRKDLNLGNAPFLAGELAPTGACSQHNALVAKLPDAVSNAFVVSAADLKLDPADTQYHLHFDHDSQVTFGKRYESVMVQALHW